MPTEQLSAGPWRGVRTTEDPFDDSAESAMLQDAQNVYIPDASAPTGMYARPGFALVTPTWTTTNTGQAVCTYTMTALDGTIYRFLATNGKLYRLSGAGFVTSTDVTPVGVTISTAATPTTRMYMTAFADELIFSDGVNRPWRGTNLSATPITGTYIDLDGAAGSWTAQGAPTVYSGTLFFIAKTVPGGSSVEAGVGLVWSEPFQPDIGYVQTGYANFWNLIQQSASPIFALAATNTYLYYFREYSIGAITGAPGANFSTTASADVISQSTGCTAPASIVQAGDNIFFTDTIGRPWMFSVGSEIRPLWKQLRGQFETTPSLLAYPAASAMTGVGAFVQQLNVVIIGGWSSSPTSAPYSGPTTLYCFDADSGQYYGRWSGATSSTLTTFDSLTIMKDSGNATTVMAVTVSGTSAKGFVLSLLSGANWQDNAQVPTRTIKTQCLGYSGDKVYNATRTGVAVVQSTAPVTVTVQTPYTSSTTICTAQATNSSQDGTYRVPFGMNVMSARGITMTLQPTTAANQWIVQRIQFPVVASKARPEEF